MRVAYTCSVITARSYCHRLSRWKIVGDRTERKTGTLFPMKTGQRIMKMVARFVRGIHTECEISTERFKILVGCSTAQMCRAEQTGRRELHYSTERSVELLCGIVRRKTVEVYGQVYYRSQTDIVAHSEAPQHNEYAFNVTHRHYLIGINPHTWTPHKLR
jgi:hypothetical protein